MPEPIFDANRVATLEAEGWRAYYDHKWPRMLRLMVVMTQEQFHIPFPVSLVAAYYVTRASVAWVPVDHDVGRVLAYLFRFYRVARQYAHLRFDPARAARAELAYFDVHRRVAEHGAEHGELVDSLTELHSALFGLEPAVARESAEARAEAAALVDGITSHRSTDIEGDWVRIETALQRCYASVLQRLDGAEDQGTTPA